MTLWITLAAVLVILLFLVTRRVGVSLEGSEERLTVLASFSRLQFTLYPRNAGDNKKKEVKHEEDKGQERKPKDSIKNVMEWLRLLGDFSEVAKKGLNFLRRYGRIAKLNLIGRVGSGDPYLTGILSGLIEGLRGILGQAVPFSRIEVTPEFGEERLDLEGTFEADIRLIYLILLIIFALWSLPKRKIWRLVRS